jgi:glucose/arabinose dehydrogenase
MTAAWIRSTIALLAAIPLLTLAIACGDDSDSGAGDPQGEVFGFGLSADTLASDGIADRVSAMEFAPDGRLFYTEQLKGTIRTLNADGTPAAELFAQITVAEWAGLDWGLTGLALDPDFATNHYVYVFYTEPVTAGDTQASPPVNPTGRPVLARFTEQNGIGTAQTVISSDFPETSPGKAGFNANGEIRFGPDGKLYVSLGDYDLFDANPELVTSLETPIGKLLRVNPDGTAPDDNPFVDDPAADPRIFATGFRDPFPFSFAEDGTLYGTDNTTVSCEELNIIESGLDYGWPQMGEFPFSDCAAAPGEQPIYNMSRDGQVPGDFLSLVEVSGLAELTGSSYAELGDSLLICESRKSSDASGENRPGVLKRMVLSNPSTVDSYEQVSSDCFGEVRTKEGQVYYATQSAIRKLVEGGTAEDQGSDDSGEEQTPPPVPTP